MLSREVYALSGTAVQCLSCQMRAMPLLGRPFFPGRVAAQSNLQSIIPQDESGMGSLAVQY